MRLAACSVVHALDLPAFCPRASAPSQYRLPVWPFSRWEDCRRGTFSSPPAAASPLTDYQTFFDTDVDSLIPGPATLDFLADYTSRHVASVDSVISILQVRSRSTFTSLSNQILFLARPPQALRHRAAVRACCRTLRTGAHEDAGATCERGG